MTGLALVIMFSSITSVMLYKSNIFSFSAEFGLSGFLYKTSVINHYVYIQSILTCAALCGTNDECLAYSYNNKEHFCRTYKEIFCTTSDADSYSNTVFYINPGQVGVVQRVTMQCKTTKQSSTRLNSKRAIDGIWTPSIEVTCSRTHTSNYPWWWIDLVYLYKVHSVVLLNRNSKTNYHFLSKVQVFVGMTLESLEPCGYREEAVPRSNTSEIACEPAPVKGKFVKIRLNKKNVQLTMCEVAVNAEHVLN